MSKTYRVHFGTGASLGVTVTVEERDDAEETREAAIEAAYELSSEQYLCAHCSGFGRDWGVDLGDWELEDGDDAVSEVSA